MLLRCTLRVFGPSNRQEHRSGNRKSLQCQSIRRSLAAWGDEDEFVELILLLLAQPSNKSSNLDKPSLSSANSATHTNVKQCLRKVEDDHFTAAVKVLCSSGVASLGNDTLKALVAKHPTIPPPVMPDFLLTEPPLVMDADKGSAIAGGLLKAISAVVNLCLASRCPKTLAKFVACAPLTPLLKLDNGIRPIAVGVV
ncbi:hypothetical protein E3N88_13689 [Mikania micrantha]|uniref:Uncharacterized protein n=1 Tax=Mikania micrantha TaxID=192012 RepID=A0A5N6NZA9_9ASTR|nr:hypothetical protein E3N88_13689 [Mikania micrantha]